MMRSNDLSCTYRLTHAVLLFHPGLCSHTRRSMEHDLVVLFEHPEWQKPLWAALEKRGVRYAAFDLKQAAFDPDALPHSALYFNQASPSAYVRGNTRAVPLALSL